MQKTIAMNPTCINFAPQFRTTAIDIGSYNLLSALKTSARLIQLTLRGYYTVLIKKQKYEK